MLLQTSCRVQTPLTSDLQLRVSDTFYVELSDNTNDSVGIRPLVTAEQKRRSGHLSVVLFGSG